MPSDPISPLRRSSGDAAAWMAAARRADGDAPFGHRPAWLRAPRRYRGAAGAGRTTAFGGQRP
jgi:hypothetical protein